MYEPLIEALQKINDEIEARDRALNNKLAEIRFLLDDVLAAIDTVELIDPPDFVNIEKESPHFGTES